MNETQNTHDFYDFNSGNGLIPAHRHCNGGGWVADTAQIADTVYVGRYARVFGHAKIKDNATITGNAEVSGYAIVKDNACVKGNAVIRGTCTIMDNAKISDNVFIASHIEIGGDTVLNGEYRSFRTKDCLECPALLDDTYGSTKNTRCLYCLEKWSEYSDSRRTSIRSWLPKNGSVNQNIDTKADAPQKRRTDNP